MSDRRTLVLGQHINFLSGFPFSSTQFSQEDGIPLIRIRDVTHNCQPEAFYTGDYANTYLVENGDILIGMDGDFSIVRWSGGIGVLNQRVMKISEREGSLLDLDYIFYWLTDFLPKLNAITAATTVKHLSVKDLAMALVDAPPKNIQKKIAAVLNKLECQINTTQDLINKHTHIKNGIMADLFSRGIDPATGKLRPCVQEAPELYYDTQLGFIPKGWVYGLLKRFVRAAEYGISTSLNEDTTGIPVLRMNNIQSNRFDVSDLKYTKVSDAYRLKLKKGDVLYNRTNSMEHVGKTALWRGELEECSFASYLVRLNLHEDQLRPAYFAHWMSQVSSQNALRAFATPAVQQVNINPTNLQRVEICCPGDPHEQELIVERIDALDDNIAAESANLIKLQDQKAGLMRDLLTGKVPFSA
ncbi:restriction endonuclease subunit S [Aeromonas enteropelogenes]|uniref:restriction endonuclease subunit S n=1 Tax=Aeromonas enteropelogenes TaxID=29489 RepID=UPI0039897557